MKVVTIFLCYFTFDLVEAEVSMDLEKHLKKANVLLKLLKIDPKSFINVATELNETECNRAVEILVKDVLARKTWALEVLDAWGKAPADIFKLNRYWLGDMDECLKVKPPYEFSSKYCLLGVTNATIIQPLNRFIPYMYEKAHVGMCLPSTCQPAYIERVLNSIVFPEMGKNLSMAMKYSLEPSSCHTADEVRRYSLFNLIVLCGIGALIAAILFGSIQEIFFPENKDFALMKCFSIRDGWMDLFSSSTEKSDGLNGIKGLIALSIASTHFVTFMSLGPLADLKSFSDAQYHFLVRYNYVLLDVFFTLSGAFSAVSFMRIQKTKEYYDPGNLLLNRYLRLYIPAATVILLKMGLAEHLSTGPMYSTWVDFKRKHCYSKNLLDFFLIFDNISVKDTFQMCFANYWFLSIDTQLFVFGQLVLYTSKWHRRAPFYISGACCFAMAVYHFCIALFYRVVPEFFFFTSSAPQELDFTIPWSRGSAYIVGIVLGLLIARHRERPFDISKNTYWWLWTGTIAALAPVITYNFVKVSRSDFYAPITVAFYLPYARCIHAVASSWILFCLYFKQADFLSKVLSFWPIQFLGKINVEIFYVHLFIIEVVLGGVQDVWHITPDNPFFYFFTTVPPILFWSTVFKLMVSDPCRKVLGKYTTHIELFRLQTFMSNGPGSSIKIA